MRPTMALLQAMRHTGSQSEIMRHDKGKRGAQHDQVLRIVVPSSCTLEQGSEMYTDVSLCRGVGFTGGDVELDVASNGITVTPTRASIEWSDRTAVQIKLQAGDDVACGDHLVHVTGITEEGEVVSTAFTVTVIPRQH